MGNRLRHWADLLLIGTLALLLIVVVALFPSNALRAVLGLPFILFFPGYVVVAALFPRIGEIGPAVRMALSFGLSVALAALVGLVLNYTSWGVSLYPMLASLTVVIVAGSGVACYRRLRLAPADRFAATVHVPRLGWWGLARLDRAASIALAVSVVAVAGAVAYLVAVPTPGATSTEFYVLGLEGEVGAYPETVALGDEASVTVGIVNHEGAMVHYLVEVYVSDVMSAEVGPLPLDDEGKWEGAVSFVPWQIGDGQRVDFVLYRDGEAESYKTLHILIDVTGMTGATSQGVYSNILM